MKRRNRILLISILLIGVLIGAAVGVIAPEVFAVPAPTVTPGPIVRPQPPHIDVWGIPDPQGGEPAECAGEPNCGLMCFYISEDAAANQYELSCVPWIFE